MVGNVNTGNHYRNWLPAFHYWPLVNQEPAIIEGMVTTYWPTTVFKHMVKILLYRKTLLLVKLYSEVPTRIVYMLG